jgi:hypothetical protein
MKAQFGALVVAGSGKINGWVASRNRGGAYFRTKVTPINPSTSAQQNARGILGSLSTQWSQLTEAERLSFNNAVADFATTDIFGDIRNPSGINLFVKLNTNLINTGQAQITAAPAKEEFMYSGIHYITMDVSLQSAVISLGNGANDSVNALVFATPTLSNGTTFVKNRLRLVGSVLIVADEIDFAAGYASKYGAFALGANIVAGFRIISTTGQASVFQSLKATVSA